MPSDLVRCSLRLATLQAANDRIGNAIAELPIFPTDAFASGAMARRLRCPGTPDQRGEQRGQPTPQQGRDQRVDRDD